jgi:hypothetical protein
MTPVDKATQKQKDENEREVDLRRDWEKDDIESNNRAPHLEELDEDPNAVGE